MKKPTETDLVRQVRDYLRLHRWLVVRLNGGGMKVGNRFVRFSDTPGLPDLIGWKGGVTLMVECKRTTGVRKEQAAFHEAARLAGCCVVVARGLDDVVKALEGVP